MMRPWCLLAIVAGGALAGEGDAPSTPQGYYTSGQTYGAGKVTGTKQGITGEVAQDKVPGYNTSPLETAHFGLMDLVTPRDDKISGCGSATLDPKNRSDQECLAINLIRRAPSTRPQYTINPATDPTILRSDQIVANPEQYAGELDGEYAGCRTTTNTVGAVYDTAVCNEYRTATTHECERTLTATVTSSADGDTETLALVTADLWLYREATGIKLRSPAGIHLVGNSVSFDAAALGTKAGTRLTVSHNGCAIGLCSGTASWSVTRSDGSVWKKVEATFDQSVDDACPKTYTLAETWASGTVTLNVTVGCPATGGAVPITASRTGSTSYCASPDVSAGATLSVGSSLNINKDAQCWGMITYRGSGAFSYAYWSKHNSGDGSVKAISFPMLVSTSNRWDSHCADYDNAAP